MEKDGSFYKLLIQYHGDMIKKANLANRNLIILKNPVLPEDSPRIAKLQWLPKKHEQAIIKNNH